MRHSIDYFDPRPDRQENKNHSLPKRWNGASSNRTTEEMKIKGQK